MVEPVDDEAEFWKRFFESIQPVRIAVSDALSNLADTPPVRVIRKTMTIIEAGTEKAGNVGKRISEYSYAAILRSPGIVVALLLLTTALIGRDALEFEHQINGDVEIYLQVRTGHIQRRSWGEGWSGMGPLAGSNNQRGELLFVPF